MRRRLLLPLVVALLLPAPAAARLPGWWPKGVQLGLSDHPGGAAALRRAAPFGFRYQYLPGGADTGSGWETYNLHGTFASLYVRESWAHRLVPVFSYYMVEQSSPGLGGGAEDTHDLAVLRSPRVMWKLYADLSVLFRRIAGTHRPAVVQVEPDLWGYIEQRSRGDAARTVPAAVASTGARALRGLPNDARGFAQAVVRLRDRLAPHVVLGYHLSVWGTKVDPLASAPSAAGIARLAARSARFERSLHAQFDVSFAEFSDRDADFYKLVRGDPHHRYGPAAFARHREWMAGFHRRTRLPLILWQIPLGNRVMRAMNDTTGHYQSDEVPWLLGARGGRAHMAAYRRAGVVAFLFGGGADGTTCACDAMHDGVTNPAPIDGNTTRSRSADDDGGYFKARARAYYRAGALGR